MNRNQRRYDLPELPATNDRKAQGLWNPDGQASQVKVDLSQIKRETPQCGKLTVENGTLICHRCKHPHTLAVKDIDKFIKENPDLMEPLTHKVP